MPRGPAAALTGVAQVPEHVGSTAVPGLDAKPVIDVDVVVPDQTAVKAAIVVIEPRLRPFGIPLHLRWVCHPQLLGHEVQHRTRHLQRVL
jgi:GrpB-like predicted nucleotidyltransferase (UPF0157 family)